MRSWQPVWTHIALRCSDLDRSVAFYLEYCGLEVVHRREDPAPDGKGTVRVAWLQRRAGVGGRAGVGAGPGAAAGCWIVLLEARKAPGPTSLFDHLGFAVSAREEVERVAERAREAGILHWPAEERGGVVGYVCGVRDPDGNVVEFSYGQDLERA